MGNNSGSILNSAQERRLRATLDEADRLLSEIGLILNSAASKSPFPKYIVDLTPVQRKTIEDYMGRVRVQLARVLEGQNIAVEPPSIPATRAIHSALTFLDIAVEELRPRYMQGYGEVPPVAAAELNGIVGELSASVRELDRYVTQSGQDLQQRVAKLESMGANIELLQELERIISEHCLVEFRSALGMVLSRLEDTSFEVAVFGRVSSGKSSLLNVVLGTDILPVGVTPVTAVPTRLIYGNPPGLFVWFANPTPEQYAVTRLGEFASEQQNPGNAKLVSRILVRLPSPWLKKGVAFVDTPGLGSLATSGATETMAYLPRCDLGVVLIDTGSPLTAIDLQTIDALYRAGIPTQVLLSKADLLAQQDLDRMLRYTAEHLKSEAKTDLTVHPVSVMGNGRELLNQWFEQEIVPLLAQCQELRSASVGRKIDMLCGAVEFALHRRLQRSGQVRSSGNTESYSHEADLRRAAAWIEEAASAVKGFADSVATDSQAIFLRAAERLLALWAHRKHAIDAAAEVRQATLEQVQGRLKVLHGALASLADELEKQLASTAEQLGTPDRPTDQEFHGLIREMPGLDLGIFDVSVSRPSLAGLLGKRFQIQTLAQKLDGQAGTPVSNALMVYGRLLSDWCSTILSQMERRFVAYADAYRAQADLGMADFELSAEERGVIERDLRSLAAFKQEETLESVRQVT
jgi:GTP-binding protein EngB required for normal cell division